MREAHPRERTVGVEWYVSDADGVGGQLKVQPEDFRVREVEAFDVEPPDADPGSYPHVVFRATLRDWDTNDFARAVSDRLSISRERVSWAGTKDKRAVTTQLFSVEGIDPGDLPDLDGADAEVVGRAGRPVLFGDLAGNAFEIVVREPERPENAAAVAEELRAFGFGTPAVPNFFGPQRFGSYRPVTHEVGLAVLRGSWEEAVLTYVGQTSDEEPTDTRAAREFVRETRDWQAALDRLPGKLRYERSMLHALVENGGETEADFREALERLPGNLQRLFVHAAQSYAFNRMLSERLKRGLPFDRAVAGDVVCFADRDAPGGIELPDPDRLQRADEGRVGPVNRHCERGRAFVTAPLVGTASELAGGEQGEIERTVLDDLGLERGDFDLPGEFGSTGTRRAVLVRTDLAVERDPLTFSFALPKGSYATTVLREFLKVDPLDLS